MGNGWDGSRQTENDEQDTCRNFLHILSVKQAPADSTSKAAEGKDILSMHRLRQYRQNRGWTQVVMAEKVGIDRSYISDMERGKKNVCLPTLEIMSIAFEVTISQFLKGL
jgi:DNA-binding XRE family transcriptional regulator